MFTPHKALITGGAGFIGFHLARHLSDAGCQVTILDNLDRQGSSSRLLNLRGSTNVNLVSGDVRIADSLWKPIAQAEVVYHLAAQTAVTKSLRNRVVDFETNAGGTFNVLETALNAPRPPIVFYASTNKVYGNLSEIPTVEQETRYVTPDAIHEDQCINPQTPYGISKAMGDLYALDYYRQFGLRTIIFRQSCIYGTWQEGSEDQGWIYHFLKSAENHQKITIFGNGKQVRDILYIDDLIRAIAFAVEGIDRTMGQVYNIGGGMEQSVSLLEFWEMAEPIIKIKPKLSFADWRADDQKVYISDTRKASDHFNWHPTIGFEEGISRTIEDIRIPF